MAVVNIPIGGQVVGIEVPDFALETTQRDIFDQMKQQVAALQAIEASLTGQNASLNKIANATAAQNNDEVVDELKDNKKSSNKNSKKLLDGVSSLTSAVFKGQKASTMVSGVLGSLSNLAGAIPGRFGDAAEGTLAGLSTAAGLIIGVLEEFGDATSKTVRAGIGLTGELDHMSDMAGRLGVTFDQLASIAMTYGTSLRTLGENTFDGARNLEQLTTAFKDATAQQGYYGLANSEMINLLLEEAEIRRVSRGDIFLEAQARNTLALSVAEMIKQNTAMARITGQEVQARIAARREIEQNAVAQSYFRTLTEEQQEKILQLAANMETIPGGGDIVRSMVESIATNTDFQMDDPRFVSFLEQPLRDLFNFVQTEVEGSMSVEEFSARALALQGQLGSDLSNAETLRLLARTGDEAARRALSVMMAARPVGTGDEVVDLTEEYLRLIGEGGDMGAAGLAADMESAAASISSLLRQFTEEALGQDLANATNSLRDVIQLFSENLDRFTNLLERNNFLPRPEPEDYTNPVEEIPMSMADPATFSLDPTPDDTTSLPAESLPVAPNANETEPAESLPVAPNANETEQPDTTVTPINYSPSEFEDAILRAFERMMANGGLPVNVRNWNQIPRRPPSETSMT